MAGQRRLSDFHARECAGAELDFTARLWPDFDEKDLAATARGYERCRTTASADDLDRSGQRG